MKLFLAIAPHIDSAKVVVSEAVDSARTALLDTAGRSTVEKTFIETMNKVTNTPPDQILSDLTEKAIQFGLKVVAALLIYFIGGYLIRWVKKFLSKVFAKKKTEAAIVSFTLSLVSALLWTVVIIVAVGTLGVETTSLAALLAAGGMAIGMALSGTVQNFAGGIMILAFKPFKVGDFIDAQGYSGTVSEMNITSTKIITPDNKVVILPNGALSSGSINNFSKMPQRRVDWTVSVEYGTDAQLVKEQILSILNADSRILGAATGAPADPFVAVLKLNESSVDFVARAWVVSADYWDVFFSINEQVYTELPKHGIGFPFPHLNVHVK